MLAVCRAIHIRTGERAASERIDAWLKQHGVEVVALADVYEGCVYLLKQYAQVPDLVLFGADWLAADEFALVRYIRETWPRAGVVIYGGSAEMPSFDWAPWTCTCCAEAALQKLLAEPPAALLQRLAEQSGVAAPLTSVPADERDGSTPARRPAEVREPLPLDQSLGADHGTATPPGSPTRLSSKPVWPGGPDAPDEAPV